ncbi:hypothetical protein HYH02_013156 [Chlamydomonas schloesseri]|uniref:Uncharacterized protein n=1 Tax=Chlamydomonas schloesseri TaxID=2026947 RepID=A0A835VZT1_9CHLO|nr:hypothetical protein HYH02_013156 [Chlamydomonas schloesseri]|eukprot:KAG2431938.1 hypothetical protein HYH02_013156 [Chlamydomonas schloesseri]
MGLLTPEQAALARTKFEELKKLTEQRQAVNVELLTKLSRALEKVGIKPGAAAPVAVAGSKQTTSSVKRPSLPAGIPDAKRPKLDSETDKKIQDIWRLCGQAVDYLLKKKNAQIFGRPVDPARDGVPDYLKFISHPMDLGTIKSKLRERRYNDPREFAADMRLVWSNCRTYNQIGTPVRQWGDQLSDDFERKWAEYNCEQRWDDLMATRDPQNVSLDRRIASSARQLLQRVNSVHQLPEADPSRTMTSVEKRKLSIALSELQGDQLADVLNIIAENLKDVNPDDDEEIELDVDQLDNTTLWRLREYCDNVANRGAGVGGHVAPSKAAPARAAGGGGGGATGAVSRPAHDNGKQQSHAAKPAARTESGSESDRYSAEQDVKGSNMVEQPQSNGVGVGQAQPQQPQQPQQPNQQQHEGQPGEGTDGAAAEGEGGDTDMAPAATATATEADGEAEAGADTAQGTEAPEAEATEAGAEATATAAEGTEAGAQETADDAEGAMDTAPASEAAGADATTATGAEEEEEAADGGQDTEMGGTTAEAAAEAEAAEGGAADATDAEAAGAAAPSEAGDGEGEGADAAEAMEQDQPGEGGTAEEEAAEAAEAEAGVEAEVEAKEEAGEEAAAVAEAAADEGDKAETDAAAAEAEEGGGPDEANAEVAAEAAA